MKCEKIRDLILTDFLDDQLSSGIKKKVESHLDQCVQCREFLHSLQEAAVLPFKQAQESLPPEFVWQRIKAGISGIPLPERAPVQAPGGFFGWLAHAPRPVYVLAALLVLVSAFFIRGRINTRNSGQAEYAEYYASLSEESFNNEGDSYGTLIEEYFL